MKLNLISSLIIISFVFDNLNYLTAQQNHNDYCGTSIHTQLRNIELQQNTQNSPKDFKQIQYLPMQIHIVLTDEGGTDYPIQKLRESICTLNKDYEPTGFQFFMDKPINYIRSSKYNEHNYDDGGEMMRIYNVKNVINVYLVTSPAGNCGYYTYNDDAVALSKSCTSKFSHTWAHEFGHYFSLPHTFLGWEGISYTGGKSALDFEKDVKGQIENIERINCNRQADNFCDTPADYISFRWPCTESDSSVLIQKDLKGHEFRSDASLFMSYSLDNCGSRFSNMQMEAMQNFLWNSRSNLLRNVGPRLIAAFDNNSAYPLDSALTKTKVSFSWKPVDQADSYLFQVARNQVFSVFVKNMVINATNIEIDSLIPGKTYYWRVIPLNNSDFCSDGSKSFIFTTESLTNINPVIEEKNILYPNPIHKNESMFIHSTEELDANDIHIFDQNGKNIDSQVHFNIVTNWVEIQTSQLNSGIYFVAIKRKFNKIIILE
ncbi:MAG: T9SS type A sorting domain-containing protein [Saprospiraceae bacterium]